MKESPQEHLKLNLTHLGITLTLDLTDIVLEVVAEI